MAANPFHCGSDARRRAVADAATLNGIDFLEVSDDQLELRVRFLHPLPGGGAGAVPPPPAPALTTSNVVVEGGARRPGIRVLAVTTAADLLTVTVSEPGDFSTYRLRLLDPESEGDAPPAGFDPQLASVDFSFKAGCPSQFDCPGPPRCEHPPLAEPEIDYLAKDYASFRRLMLDRLAALLPDWRERNPADAHVALVELLAYVADRQSYQQDAVGVEAYLPTARRRVSVRRHARLLDYRMHDGCSARAFVHLTASQDGALATTTELLTADELVFQPLRPLQPLHPLLLRTAQNKIPFHTWSEESCCLPAGATRATLSNSPDRQLAPGDLLLLEEVAGPESGLEADADHSHRQVVRLVSVRPGVDPLDGSAVVDVEWGLADALRFPLCVSARVPGEGGALELAAIAVARGNVVVADHGQTFSEQRLDPPAPPSEGRWRPRPQHGPLAVTAPLDPAAPAAAALVTDPRQALPDVDLQGQGLEWSAVPDLLASDGLAPEFVVETEADGTATLRFGDGLRGRVPEAGADFTATYRVGGGSAGNVGADTIVAWRNDGGRVSAARNPLPASGGTDPEPAELVKLLAPHAFRRQERAVTAADYAAMAERHPEVQRAVASLRWTGSWHTVFVAVDRAGGVEVTPEFEEALRDHLERFRRAGHDLEVSGPLLAPLRLALEVCVAPGFFAKQVEEALLERLLAEVFHPDRLTFGQPVYLSQVHRAATEVPGVEFVRPTAFHRFGRQPAGELKQGVARPGPLEILQLANDPNFPERGALELSMAGGR